MSAKYEWVSFDKSVDPLGLPPSLRVARFRDDPLGNWHYGGLIRSVSEKGYGDGAGQIYKFCEVLRQSPEGTDALYGLAKDLTKVLSRRYESESATIAALLSAVTAELVSRGKEQE